MNKCPGCGDVRVYIGAIDVKCVNPDCQWYDEDFRVTVVLEEFDGADTQPPPAPDEDTSGADPGDGSWWGSFGPFGMGTAQPDDDDSDDPTPTDSADVDDDEEYDDDDTTLADYYTYYPFC